MSKYPLLPSREYTTDRVIGQDGETVFSSRLEPRVFEVPVFFNKIDDIGLRKIAGWLNTKTDQWFFYKGDNLKIKCTLDSNGTVLESLGYSENRVDNGSISLKFIAHDPYFYEINETIHNYESLTLTTNRFNLLNSGNEVVFPHISIWGTGNITINVYEENLSQLYTSCTVNNLVSGVELDTKYRTCLTQSGGQMFNNFSGNFPLLPVGNYILEVIGSVLKVTVNPHFRYV